MTGARRPARVSRPPGLPTIPEVPPSPRPAPARDQAALREGDRVLIGMPDGTVQAATLLAQRLNGQPPVLILRLRSGRTVRLDAREVTLLRRM